MKAKITIGLLIVFSLCFLCACAKESENVVNPTSIISNTEKETTVTTESTHSRFGILDGKETDLLVIEEIVVTPKVIPPKDNASFFSWKIKVRNVSGKDLPMKETQMSIWYRYLDENGDTLYRSYISGGYNSTVENGQAEWINQAAYPADFSKNDMESTQFLEFYAYTIHTGGMVEYEFMEPILIDIRETIA